MCCVATFKLLQTNAAQNAVATPLHLLQARSTIAGYLLQASLLSVRPNVVQSSWCCTLIAGEASSPDDCQWLMAQTRYRCPILEYCGGTLGQSW